MTPTAKAFLGTSGFAALGGLTGAILGVFGSVDPPYAAGVLRDLPALPLIGALGGALVLLPYTALLALRTAHGRGRTLRHHLLMAGLLATCALGYLSFLFCESQKNP